MTAKLSGFLSGVKYHKYLQSSQTLMFSFFYAFHFYIYLPLNHPIYAKFRTHVLKMKGPP